MPDSVASLSKSVKLNAWLTTIGRVGGVVSLLLITFLVNLITATDVYAQFILASSIVYLLAPLVSLGSHDVMLSKLTSRASPAPLAFATLLISFAGAILLVLTSQIYSFAAKQYAFSTSIDSQLILIVAVALSVSLNNGLSDYLRGTGRFRLGALLAGFTGGFLQNAVQLCLLTLSAWWLTKIDLQAILIIWLLSNTIVLAIAAPWLAKELTFSTIMRDGIGIKVFEVLRASLPLCGGILISGTGAQLDIFVCSSVLSETELASFGAAKRIAVLVCYPYMLFNITIRPHVTDILRNRSSANAILWKSNLWAVGLCSLIAIPLVVFSNPIMLYCFGEEFHPGAMVLVILSIGYVLQCLSGVGGTILTLTCNGRALLISQILSISIYVAALFFLVRGMYSAAFWSSAFLVLRSSLDGLFCWRLLGVMPMLLPSGSGKPSETPPSLIANTEKATKHA